MLFTYDKIIGHLYSISMNQDAGGRGGTQGSEVKLNSWYKLIKYVYEILCWMPNGSFPQCVPNYVMLPVKDGGPIFDLISCLTMTENGFERFAYERIATGNLDQHILKCNWQMELNKIMKQLIGLQMVR